jgi:Tfp pilus assembly protein PilN
VLALHRQGDSFSVLILDPAPALKVLETRRVAPSELASKIAAMVRQHSVRQIVRVAPGARTMCRVAMVPEGEGPRVQLAGVVALLAEAQLPETLESYRRAGGVIADAPRAEGRTTLLTGWMGTPTDEPATLVGAKERVSQSWIAPAAALAALRGLSRSPGSALVAYADGFDGSVSLIGESQGRPVARVWVDDNTTDESWSSAVSRAAPGLAPASSPRRKGLLLCAEELSRDIRAGVEGVAGESSWLSSFGVALGAALTASSEDPAQRSLAALHAVAPAIREPAPARFLRWIARPGRAAGVLVASLVLALGVPLGIAWARHEIVAKKAATLEDQKKGRKDLDRRAAVYSELEKSRWPMTKVIATISAAAPEGVTLTNFRLATEQSPSLSVQGTAKSQAQIDQFQANLNRTGRFRGANVNRSESKADVGYTFDLSADIANPLEPFVMLDDWSAKPLAVRLYGEGASNTQEAPVAEKPDRTRRPSFTSAESEPATRTPSASSGELPPELKDEDIAKMERSTAMKEFTRRRSHVQKNPGLDRATKSRLESEADRLKARMDALRGGS